MDDWLVALIGFTIGVIPGLLNYVISVKRSDLDKVQVNLSVLQALADELQEENARFRDALVKLQGDYEMLQRKYERLQAEYDEELKRRRKREDENKDSAKGDVGRE